MFSPNIQVQAKNAYLTNVYSYSEGRKKINVLTVQDQLTTLKDITRNTDRTKDSQGYSNNYDHFTYSPELSEFQSVSYEVIDAVEKYCGGDFEYYYKKISDHLPIVMNIEI